MTCTRRDRHCRLNGVEPVADGCPGAPEAAHELVEIGCTAETLRQWVRKTEIDTGRRNGITSDQQARIKELERENRELRRTNEILRKASAFFAQVELDRRVK